MAVPIRIQPATVKADWDWEKAVPEGMCPAGETVASRFGVWGTTPCLDCLPCVDSDRNRPLCQFLNRRQVGPIGIAGLRGVRP